MVWQDTLWPHLLDIDQLANEMMKTIVDHMAKAQGVNERLKEDNQWRWIQMMDNIRNAAEEIVLRDVVYV